MAALALAARSQGDPARERALREALFAAWISPQALRQAREALKRSSLSHRPGHAALARVLGGLAPPSR